MEYLILEKRAIYLESEGPYAYVKSIDNRLDTLREFLENEWNEYDISRYHEIIHGTGNGSIGEHISVRRRGAYIELSDSFAETEEPNMTYPTLQISTQNFIYVLKTWHRLYEDQPQSIRMTYDNREVAIEALTPTKARRCRALLG